MLNALHTLRSQKDSKPKGIGDGDSKALKVYPFFLVKNVNHEGADNSLWALIALCIFVLDNNWYSYFRIYNQKNFSINNSSLTTSR